MRRLMARSKSGWGRPHHRYLGLPKYCCVCSDGGKDPKVTNAASCADAGLIRCGKPESRLSLEFGQSTFRVGHSKYSPMVHKAKYGFTKSEVSSLVKGSALIRSFLRGGLFSNFRRPVWF